MTLKPSLAALRGSEKRRPWRSGRSPAPSSLFFNITATVTVDNHYDANQVLAAVTAALTAAFSFNRREFGQAMTAAAVITTIQSTPGVIATDLNQLYRVDDPQGPQQTVPEQVLRAEQAHLVGQDIIPGQLLILNPVGISITSAGLPT